MLATDAVIPTGTDWAYEVKWDGMRVLAHVVGGSLRLVSRNGNDVTASFPELAPLAGLGHDAVLDGEAVCFDEAGNPSFAQIARRFGVTSTRRAAALAKAAPVTLVVFDLLTVAGRSLLDSTLRERRRELEALSIPGPVMVPQSFDDAAALLKATRERGLEGVVAKRWDSTYRPGVRSSDWIKHSHRETTDAVVLGWRTGTSGSVASLALGTPGSLEYRGTAGSGLSGALGDTLQRLLRTGPVPPIAAAEQLRAEGFGWAEPDVVVEIRHLGLTGTGRFRQPVVVRVRNDLTPPEAAPEQPPVMVTVGERTLRITHLNKVLYPAAGTTKADVLQYYATVAPYLLQLAADRPVTRRRWPDGVAATGFFEKNLPKWAPDWLRRSQVPTSKESITYPVLSSDDVAGLTWLAAHSALELHTPQWRVDGQGLASPPDRMVIDLDPGPGAGLSECAEVALAMRELLAAAGMAAHPVLSGSKGLHLYAPLPSVGRSSDEVTAQAQSLATDCGRRLPGLVVVTMAKEARAGRVFIDWSQNRAAKTTLAPWSLRGTLQPFAAVPVSWEDVGGGSLRQLTLPEVMERLTAGRIPTPW